MRKLVWGLMSVGFFLAFLIVGFDTKSQNIPDMLITGTTCDTPEVRYMWSEINDFRRRQNLHPLAFNNKLCFAAQRHADALASRQTGAIGDTFQRLENGQVTYLNNWLAAEGYQPYENNNFVANMSPYVVADLPPMAGTGSPDLVSYYLAQENNSHLFPNTLNISYREIGISYYRTIDRYIYVFIFASQPNTFPIIPVAPNFVPSANLPYEYAYRWNQSTNISLLFPNERYAPTGIARQRLGTITHLRRAINEADMVQCPDPDRELTDGWEVMPLTLARPYDFQLSGAQGLQTIYFEVCDARRTAIMSSVTLDYYGNTLPTDTPDASILENTVVPDTATPIPTDDGNVTATHEARIAAQETVFAQQTQDSALATQNSQNLAGTEYVITQTQAVIAFQGTTIAETANAINIRSTAFAEQAAAFDMTGTAFAVMSPTPVPLTPTVDFAITQALVEGTETAQAMIVAAQATDNRLTEMALEASSTANANEIMAVTLTRAVVTEAATFTPVPTQIPDTPEPTFTPSTVLPFVQLNLYWNYTDGMFIVHNPSNSPILLTDLARITIRGTNIAGQEVTYSFSQLVERAQSDPTVNPTELQAGACMLIEDLQDANDRTISDVQLFRGQCQTWNFLTGEDAILTTNVFWGTASFDVYYNDLLFATCLAAASGVSDCSILSEGQEQANTIPNQIVATLPAAPDQAAATLPLLNLRLVWSYSQGMFIIINLSGTSVPLADLQALTFVALDNNAIYSLDGLVNNAATNGVTEFAAGRCMMVQILEDGLFPDATAVAEFRNDCDVSNGLTSEDAIVSTSAFWLGSGFEVHYRDVVLVTCVATNTSECVVQR